MNISRTLVVVRKELMDAFRDKRSIYSVVIGAMIGPIMIGFLLNRIADQQRGRSGDPGSRRRPGTCPGAGQLARATTRRRNHGGANGCRSRGPRPQIDFVLVIPKEFPEKFRASRPAPVQIVSDSTRQSTHAKVQRLRSLLSKFSNETGGLRLVARGVSPAIASALNVEDVEVSSAQQRAATVFNMIPMFLALAAFVAGMHIATDSTAGERERGSLEPLLVNPIPRFELVAGKWLAAVTSSVDRDDRYTFHHFHGAAAPAD